MSAPLPLIVVTLPAQTVAEARDQARLALEGGGDVAEIRFDRWKAAERFDTDGLWPLPIPLLATFRSRSEGGAGADAPPERASVLRRLAVGRFTYVDLEIARDGETESSLPSTAAAVVRSCHLPESATPSEVRSQFGASPPPNGWLKVVVPSGFTRAVEQWAPFASGLRGSRSALLLTGAAGALWRTSAGRLGLPVVFAALPCLSPEGPVEPSQVPVDRLRSVLADPPGPVFAVVGHPVGHSRSPSLHNRWMSRANRAGAYVTLDLVSEEEFRLALSVLPSWGVRGLNVTHPWKRVAFERAGVRSESAQLTGVANCLTFDGGTIAAENTDLIAVHQRFSELTRDRRWDGRAVSVLGGGGAARATLAAARRLGARSTLYVRSQTQAESLASEFGAEIGIPGEARPSPLVVHATNVGRSGAGSLDLPLPALLGPGTHLLDWVYAPELPTLADAARLSGATYEDGRRLLAYQAAASYRVWWGEEVPLPWVRQSLEEVGCVA